MKNNFTNNIEITEDKKETDTVEIEQNKISVIN
jgi:hypothetical protein